MGDAAGGRPKSLVDDRRPAARRVPDRRLADAGVERVIVSCAAGQGDVFTEALGALGAEIVCAEEPERLGRGGGIKFAARLREEQRRRLRDERRRARRRRLRRAARAAPRDRRRGDRSPSRGRRRRSASSSSATTTSSRASARAGGSRTGSTAASTSSRREVIERLPGHRRPRVDDVPRAGRRGTPARLPARGSVADGEHAEGAPPCAGARRRPSRMARVGVGSPCSAPGPVFAQLDGSRPLRLRPAHGREAVGLRADLGRHRRLRREDPVRQGGRVAQPPVPQREGRGLVRARGRARSSSSGSAGEGILRRGDRARARRSTSRPARCTA